MSVQTARSKTGGKKTHVDVWTRIHDLLLFISVPGAGVRYNFKPVWRFSLANFQVVIDG